MGCFIVAHMTTLRNNTESKWRTFAERAIAMTSTMCKDSEDFLETDNLQVILILKSNRKVIFTVSSKLEA